jgi:hypothetical protein
MQVGTHTLVFYIENPADPRIVIHRVETILVAAVAGMIPVYLHPTDHRQSMPYVPSAYVPDPANPVISWKYSHWDRSRTSGISGHRRG